MIDLKPLVNKTVDFAYRGTRLGFDLSHALFSSFDIDTGTRLLLKEIAHDDILNRARTILDAGCGAGIIGVSLAASCPEAQVVMRDRDILACAFSERNCWRNGIPVSRLDLEGHPVAPISKKPPKHKENAERKSSTIVAPGLLGEDDPFGPFDLIVSNVPAKAGPTILSWFVEACPKRLLNPGGRLAFVIVNTLAGFADEWCAASGMTLEKKTVGKGHTVFILEKPAGDSIALKGEGKARGDEEERGQKVLSLSRYRRSSGTRKLGRVSAQASGYWGLPEFDTASFATGLAVDAMERACAGNLVRDFLVVEPGIGLATLWAAKVLGPTRIHAASRDLLSLHALRWNLETLGSPSPAYIPLQSIDLDTLPPAQFDTILFFPDDIPEYDYVSPAWEFMNRTAKIGAPIILVSSSTIIARFEKGRPSGLRRIGEKKNKGFAALMVRKST